MSATPLARRPRFLADVPDVASAEPVRFAASARPTPVRSPRPAPERGAAAPPAVAVPAAPAAPAGPSPGELAELRREAMSRVAAAVETLRAQVDRLTEGARADAIEVGFMVARKIVEAELRQGPDALFALVRSAVRKAATSRRVSVRLHPEDAVLVADQLTRDSDGPGASTVEVVHDSGLQRGDCMVDTDFGQVDGRLATRFEELRRAVDAASGASR